MQLWSFFPFWDKEKNLTQANAVNTVAKKHSPRTAEGSTQLVKAIAHFLKASATQMGAPSPTEQGFLEPLRGSCC